MVKIQRTSLCRGVSGRKRRGVEIIEACEADLEKVRRAFNLEVKTSPPDDGDAVNYVAKKDENMVGFVQLVKYSDGEMLDNGYYLCSLHVRLLYRGLGIGRDLTKEVMARAKAEGAPELRVLTNNDNRAALGLFHKLGFRMRVREEHTSLQARRKVIMTRTLVE